MVQHPLPFAGEGQFLLKGPKDLGLDRFQLKIHLVRRTAAAFHAIAALALEAIREQSPLLRQRVLSRRGTLRSGRCPGDAT